MPYKSEAQRRFFHSAGARKAGLTPSDVEHWDAASKGKKLPEHVSKHASLLKSARMSPSSKGTLIGGGLGVLGGGLLGYFSPDSYVLPPSTGRESKKKEEKRRRLGALLGALSTGVTGAYAGHAIGGLKEVADSARNWSRYNYSHAGDDFRSSYRQGDWGRSRSRAGSGFARGPAKPPSWVGNPTTKAEAKAAYRREALKNHPDRGGSVPLLQQINVEWDAFQNSPLFSKLATAAFFDELSKIANLAGLVATQLARREVVPPVTQAVSDLENDMIDKWRRFSTSDPLLY